MVLLVHSLYSFTKEHFSALLTATEEAVHKLVAIPVMAGQPKYVHSVLPPSRKIVSYS